ncbi:MAG TPA: hypothetical protein DCZ94_11405 [Lentisphaeria bacterium]|nr:MAG: hypothetical protein A2X48_17495 [Lentisphaerae bacterium GWF2_49_21]HBC87553.1 hypothetical protein [Lentisphaeria bacterium]
MAESENLNQEEKHEASGIAAFLKRIFGHISYRYHIGPRLKIHINSLMIVFPAFAQYLFFDELEYLVAFVLCAAFLSSLFLLAKARLLLTLPFVFMSFIYTLFLVIYSKSLGVTSIMALFNTKLEAMVGFATSPKMITGTMAFIIVLLLYVRFIILKGAGEGKEELVPKNKRYIPLLFLIAVPVFFILEMSYFKKAYPFSFMYDSGSYMKILSEMKKSSSAPYFFEGRLDSRFKDNTGIFILVLGESSRRASWSLYGYKRKTNVFMKSFLDKYPDNIFLFKNYITTGQTTYPSMMSLFSVMPSKDFAEIPKYPSFVRIMKNVAYKTYFLSTYDNIFLNYIYADENIITPSDDDVSLLPTMKKVISEETHSHKKLIVMHLKGSHFAFSDYNYTYKDYIFPSDNPIMDKYDNSLVHTDILLKEIADEIMKNPEPICVWYMSDHGENLNDFGDGNYGHGCGGFTCYELEIPSVMIYNNAYLEKYPKIRTVFNNRNFTVSHSNVSHTIMGLCGLYPREYKKNFDLSSDNYRYEEPYVIDVDLFPIKYSKAKIQD